MSINKKLEILLEYNPGGLMNISGTLGGIAGSLLRLPFDFGKKITQNTIKLVSDTAKSAKIALDKIEDKDFKRDLNIKDLNQIDIALGKLKADSDDFGVLEFSILQKIQSAKNVEFKSALNKIYEKNLERQIDLVKNKLNSATDTKESEKLYGSLVSMIDLIPDKKSPLIDDILQGSARYLDVGKENIRKRFEAPKEIRSIINKPIERMSGQEMQQAVDYYETQLSKLSGTITNNDMTINQKALDQVMDIDTKVKELKKKLGKRV
jgi:hypothetical protein